MYLCVPRMSDPIRRHDSVRKTNYGPLIMFIFFAVGALVGLVGWIASAVQRRKKISN